MKCGRLSIFVFFMVIPFLMNCGGGGSSDISAVKNGALGFDQSVTVGNALEGYKLFIKKEWKSLSDPQKRRIVEFSGTLDKQGMEKDLEKTSYIHECYSKFKNGTKEYMYYAQFVMSTDGKQFSLYKTGFRYVMNDGKIYEASPLYEQRSFELLASIYKNDLHDLRLYLCYDAPNASETASIPTSPAVSTPRAPAAPVASNTTTGQQMTFSPSFDCAKASSGPERLICSNKELSEVDVQLAQIFRAAMNQTKDKASLKREQTQWIRNKRDACSDSTAMLKVYQDRIAQLSSK